MRHFVLLAMLFLTGCAFFEGLKNQKNVKPIPVSEQTKAASPSVDTGSESAAITEQAAKNVPRF